MRVSCVLGVVFLACGALGVPAAAAAEAGASLEVVVDASGVPDTDFLVRLERRSPVDLFAALTETTPQPAASATVDRPAVFDALSPGEYSLRVDGRSSVGLIDPVWVTRDARIVVAVTPCASVTLAPQGPQPSGASECALWLRDAAGRAHLEQFRRPADLRFTHLPPGPAWLWGFRATGTTRSGVAYERYFQGFDLEAGENVIDLRAAPDRVIRLRFVGAASSAPRRGVLGVVTAVGAPREAFETVFRADLTGPEPSIEAVGVVGIEPDFLPAAPELTIGHLPRQVESLSVRIDGYADVVVRVPPAPEDRIDVPLRPLPGAYLSAHGDLGSLACHVRRAETAGWGLADVLSSELFQWGGSEVRALGCREVLFLGEGEWDVFCTEYGRLPSSPRRVVGDASRPSIELAAGPLEGPGREVRLRAEDGIAVTGIVARLRWQLGGHWIDLRGHTVALPQGWSYPTMPGVRLPAGRYRLVLDPKGEHVLGEFEVAEGTDPIDVVWRPR